jgi:hypothetical protein
MASLVHVEIWAIDTSRSAFGAIDPALTSDQTLIDGLLWTRSALPWPETGARLAPLHVGTVSGRLPLKP